MGNPPEWSYVLDFLAGISWPLAAVVLIFVLRKPIERLLSESESGTADLRNLTFNWKKSDKAAKQGLQALEGGPQRIDGPAVTPPEYARDVRPTLERSPRDAITRLYAGLVEGVDRLGRTLTHDEEAVFSELRRMHAGVAAGRV
ncbi:MAG TPA: hypothetical protein VMY88_08610, partial [Acidimicrobiales bacterium]|nr:hypothetical protein [Acidimicrobiales bacterium]